MKTYTTVDKSQWPVATDEPDKAYYIDPATDYDCLIVRNNGGALCGYVGLPPSHPAHGFHYNDELLYSIDVHGGLTFANSCQEDTPESQGVCHVPLPGRPSSVWWLGFDCSHLGDYSPTYDLSYDRGFGDPSNYKDISYVKEHISSLAAQLHNLTT